MSSLFGSFGNLSTSASQSQPALSTGLTSSLGNAQPQQVTAPIFSLGASSKPEQAAFGGATTGLLGTSQTTTSQPPQISSFFSSQNNTNTSQPLGTSLLLSQQPQQLQQQQNQVGQTQKQDGQQSAGLGKVSQPGYFNNLLEKGKKRALAADVGAGPNGLPSLQLGLSDIAKRARELGGVGSQTQGGSIVDGKAHYLLAASGVNVAATQRDLNALSSQPFAASTQVQTNEWDPDTNKFVAQLQQQSTLKMIAEGVDRAHRNFDAFLEENVDINWELQRRKICEHFGLLSKGSDDFNASINISGSNSEGSFGKSTRRGRKTNTGSVGKSTMNRSVFGNSGLQKSVIGTPGIGSPNATVFADVAEKTSTPVDDRFTQNQQRKYIDKVQSLNQSRLEETPYPVFQEFSSVESRPGGETPSQLVDAYQALTEIIQDPSTSSHGSQLAKERHFAEDYLDEIPNSAKAISIRKRIINGSRRCLEKQFFHQLDTLVARNPREANLGGIPTTINKVRAYVRIRAARKDLTPDGTELQTLDGEYCWALVFFCLRSGLLKEAAEYVTGNATAFRALDRNFITYITSYASDPERRLARSTQDRINAEYQQRSRIAPENSLDPYRMACYKIIGRCDLSKRTIEGLSQGSEDWIWLQFSLAREVNRAEEIAGDVFGLEEVRDTIREIGQRYFVKGVEGAGGYGVFFFLQILGGMFEQAVSYLYAYSYVAAVHFAIALDYYGLLRVSDFSISENELLTYNTKELPQISFGRMLGYYTRDFRSGDAEAAVDYLALICLNADLPGALGESQASLCHEALRELVLETREFAQLLGDIYSDGSRIKGAIEQRLKLIRLANQEEFLRTVTIQAASVADDNGRTTDAVLLYHLAEDYDNVIVIINRALSEAIATEIGQEKFRLQPLKPRTSDQKSLTQSQQLTRGSSLSLTAVDDPAVLARNMISLYNANALYYQKIRPANRDACGILLRLNEAKAKVIASQWAEALDIIDTLNLLPLHAKSSIPLIRSSAQSFNALPPSISRNVGPLLLWTITCIGQQRQILAQSPFEDATRKEMSDQLLVTAKDLMVFAGLVKYRLGERVWEAVTRCGGDVGVYH